MNYYLKLQLEFMFITKKLFCSIRERMQKHASFNQKARKTTFYTYTLLIFVKTRACRICNVAIVIAATFLYFQLYLLGEYNFFSLNAYSLRTRSGFSIKGCYSTFAKQFPPYLIFSNAKWWFLNLLIHL